MRRSLGLVIALATFVLPLHAAEPALPPSNPLPFEYSECQAAPRLELRDPCIVREGDRYYLVFTMWPFRGREEAHLVEPDDGGSPGIALYSSSDLKAWKFENWLVKSSDLPEDCPNKHHFWAPEIHGIGGKFHLIFIFYPCVSRGVKNCRLENLTWEAPTSFAPTVCSRAGI